MFDLFTNSWFISIAGGLLVTFLWESVRFIREKNAYNRHLRFVRNDFSIIIKNIIGEDVLPELYILDNLLKGITQKHGVKYKDVTDVETVFNSLTQDVMESSFLDYQNKITFCEKLENISQSYTAFIKERDAKEIEIESDNTSKFTEFLRILPTISFLLFNIGLILTVTFFIDKEIKFSNKILFDFPVDTAAFMFIAIFTITFVVYIFTRLSKIIRRNLVLKQEKDLYEFKKRFKDMM